MKIKTHNSQLKSGFTLIELLVVMFMIVTISSISVANYRKGERSRRVDQAADGVTNAIRNAQNFSLTSKQITNSACANKAAKYYRVDFAFSSQYVLYAEDNCSVSYEIERYTLPQQTQIKTNGILFNGIPVTTLAIKFTAPFAKITASSNGGAYASFTSANFIVEHVDGSKNKTIVVDGISGRIGD